MHQLLTILRSTTSRSLSESSQVLHLAMEAPHEEVYGDMGSPAGSLTLHQVGGHAGQLLSGENSS